MIAFRAEVTRVSNGTVELRPLGGVGVVQPGTVVRVTEAEWPTVHPTPPAGPGIPVAHSDPDPEARPRRARRPRGGSTS